MEELVRESIFELGENDRYIVIDRYKINNNDYVLFIAEEKAEDEDENIYVLRVDKDEKGEPFLSDISKEELNDVLNYMYSLYEEAGVYNNGEISFEKIYEISNNPEILDKYKTIKELEDRINNNGSEELNETKEKLKKAKKLMEEYNDTIAIYINKTESLENQNKGLQENNEYLQESFRKIPKFFRNMFVKDKKMLK